MREGPGLRLAVVIPVRYDLDEARIALLHRLAARRAPLFRFVVEAFDLDHRVTRPLSLRRLPGRSLGLAFGLCQSATCFEHGGRDDLADRRRCRGAMPA